MNIKTSELTGAALDWAVAKCEVYPISVWYDEDELPMVRDDGVSEWRPSTEWAQGGPIIEREGISINSHLDGYEWFARDYWGLNEQAEEKPLIAAMRCFVTSKLGDTVEVPAELLEGV